MLIGKNIYLLQNLLVHLCYLPDSISIHKIQKFKKVLASQYGIGSFIITTPVIYITITNCSFREREKKRVFKGLE
jgi:hypothetical protein